MTNDRPAPLVATSSETESTTAPALQPVKLLIYGTSGVGKTALAGTAEDDPRTSPVLFLDLENGARTISWRNKAIRVMSTEDIHSNLEGVLEVVRAGKAIHRPSGQPYKSVVIDSITAGASLIYNDILHGGHRARGAPEDILEYGEWNNYTHRLLDLIRGFRDAGLHLIVTAQEQAADDGMRPAVEGAKAREGLPQAFDIVGRLFIARQPALDGNGVTLVRRILLQNDGKVVAKSRGDAFGQLPPTYPNPTIEALLDYDERGRMASLKYAQEHYGY